MKVEHPSRRAVALILPFFVGACVQQPRPAPGLGTIDEVAASGTTDATGSTGDTSETGSTSDTSSTVSTEMTGGSGPSGPMDPAPMINVALDCGTTGQAGGLAPAPPNYPEALVRGVIDTTVFPEALCNDGTTPVFYYRPANDPGASNKWVILLQGGGTCDSAESCAKRWCHVDDAFSMHGMSSSTAPLLPIAGKGIEERQNIPFGASNSFEHYNHVFVKYCSSDGWSGTKANVELDTVHPIRTTEPVHYRAHFLGQRILDAVIATLRSDGVAALPYGAGSLPDLDDATEVVLAGASAGGFGVTFNLDRIAETLQANSTLPAPSGEVEVLGLVDSVLMHELRSPRFDFSTSPACLGAGACTGAAVSAIAQDKRAAVWGFATDATCLSAHPSEPSYCGDVHHVLAHHVTTPNFVRMGLTDSLLSQVTFELGMSFVPDPTTAPTVSRPLTLSDFAVLTREALRSLDPAVPSSEETRPLTGYFGPRCSQHDTLRSDVDVFEVTIDPPLAALPVSFFEIWSNWRAGTGRTSIVSLAAGADTECTP